MAERLYDTLKVAVEESKALNRRIVFGGHSLGGSLSLLLCVLYILRLDVRDPQTVTFGSPPVLSHKLSRGGDGVMQVPPSPCFSKGLSSVFSHISLLKLGHLQIDSYI